MKTSSRISLRNLIPIILMALSLQGCNFGASGTWRNENIPKGKSEQIKKLNDKLFKALKSSDMSTIRTLMSDVLLKKITDLDKLINQVTPALKSDNYRILDEYNVTNGSTEIGNHLISGISGDNDYTIDYQALNKDMYASLLLPNDDNSELLITVIYGNYDNEWKINILQFGQFSYFKKNAIDYYKMAKASYDKSYLIDAVNYIGIARQCSQPANKFFHYQKEKDINELYDKIMKEVNGKYQFPLTLDKVATKPKVFRIYPEMIDGGFYPIVLYLTSINLKDTTSLKSENKNLKAEIGSVFPGIDKDKKVVVYQAFNEIPDGKRPVEHYGFVAKQ